jgi:cell filamentation protein
MTIQKVNRRIAEVFTEQSKYCYEGTDILINKLGIEDEMTLENIERTMTTYNLSRLYLEPIEGNFDVDHYLKIHKFLFDYLYDFAGKIRVENMSKGNTPFCRPEYIYKYLRCLLQEMKKKIIYIETVEQLVEFLAYYYSEINIVHPFREGNGRTQREFFREYVHEMSKKLNFGNYELDYSLWDNQDHKQLILGSILSSHNGDLSILKSVLGKCLVQVEVKKIGKNR